ncbi:MAG TPA: DUF6580 family putative transport protein [Chthoniobacterales bacterium]|nr:DUF6580 family putative transport protein [Chthoniobacterales bacterium]
MIPAFLLVLIAVLYRVVMGPFVQLESASLANFAPLAAIALCSAAYFPAKYKFTVPLVLLFVSDIILNLHYGADLLSPLIISRYFGLIVIGLAGVALQNCASIKTMLAASLAGSLLLYLIANTFSWLSDPGYTENFAGFIQAQTVGLPAYSSTPTWMFLRNSMLGDLLFTSLFVFCVHYGRSPERARASCAVPRAA